MASRLVLDCPTLYPTLVSNGEETTLELVLNLFSSQNQILLPTTLVSIPYPWIFVQDGGLVGMLDSNQLWSMLHPLLVVPWFTILPAKPGQTQLLQKLLLDLLRLLASLQTESPTDMGERIAIMNLDFVEGTVSYT